MFRTMTARYSGTCKRCRETFAAGTRIRYGGRGRTYHMAAECEASEFYTGAAESTSSFKSRTGRCEDAPCCGCCGPQGDGDYYGRYAAEAAYERETGGW